MDDPYGSSRGTHNYPSPNAAHSHTHSAADLCATPPACNPAVVDKSSGTRCMYRLELWFRKKDEADNSLQLDGVVFKGKALKATRMAAEK